jgi:serine/threonine protein kinase
VQLARKKSDGQRYAIKRISKHHILKTKSVMLLYGERNVMASVSKVYSAPFLCGLAWSFQTEKEIFLVMPAALGGDLTYQLENRKHLARVSYSQTLEKSTARMMTEEEIHKLALPEEDHGGGYEELKVKFFAAEIVCALEQLHKHHVLYRDLKPRNVLIDEEGHILLSDFGLSYQLLPEERYYTTHRAGTPGYMAPEMLAGFQYSFSSDYFSLGATIYELFHGRACFHGPNFVRLPKREALKPHLWRYHISPELSRVGADFLKQLLKVDPMARLGGKFGPNGIDAIKNHAWFRDIKWDHIVRKDFEFDYIPQQLVSVLDVLDGIGEEEPVEVRKIASVPKKYQVFFANFGWNLNQSTYRPGSSSMEEVFAVADKGRPSGRSSNSKNKPSTASNRASFSTVDKQISQINVHTDSPSKPPKSVSELTKGASEDPKAVESVAIASELKNHNNNHGAGSRASFMERAPRMSDVGRGSFIVPIDGKVRKSDSRDSRHLGVPHSSRARSSGGSGSDVIDEVPRGSGMGNGGHLGAVKEVEVEVAHRGSAPTSPLERGNGMVGLGVLEGVSEEGGHSRDNTVAPKLHAFSATQSTPKENAMIELPELDKSPTATPPAHTRNHSMGRILSHRSSK